MMFKDYYSLLEIDETASQDEIKKAFRGQAVKWHPDRNKGLDTTSQMQAINEAYTNSRSTSRIFDKWTIHH